MTTPGEGVRALVLATLVVFSVFAGTAAFAGTSFAAGNTAGSVGISLSEAGNSATVTVDDADLNTDGGSAQSVTVNVESDSEQPGSATQDSSADTDDGSTQDVFIYAPVDVTGDDAVTAADLSFTGADDERIKSVSKVGAVSYKVVVEDTGGSTTDSSVETIGFTQLGLSATSTDTTDTNTQTVTTNGPVGDRNEDGSITAADVILASSSPDESISNVAFNPDGTATVTIADSGGTADSSETDGGQTESVGYLRSETVTLTETGPDTGSFAGTVPVSQTDSDGVVFALEGDTVTASYWDGGTTKRVATGTANYPPTISNVFLGESEGNMVVQFDSDEQLGGAASDVAVSVTGPNGKRYPFDRTAFSESGTGPYTYSLAVSASYDDGEGTYSLSVDDAKDAAGNNGGNSGAGSGLGASYTFSTGGDTEAPSISGFDASNPSDTTIDVWFWSDEQLDSIDVGLTGPEDKTLTRSDFSESAESGGYAYTATYLAGSSGDYTATLNAAVDGAGNDGASGESDTVSVGGDGGGESGPNVPAAPYVSLETGELSTGGFTSLFLMVNATGEVDSYGDLELRFYNASESTSSPIATQTNVGTLKGFAMVEVPQSELGAKQFNGKVELVDTTSDTIIDSDTRTITVYSGVKTTVDHTTLDNSKGSGIEVGYELGNLKAENAKLEVKTITLNSGFTTVQKPIDQQSGTVTIATKASDVNRNFTVVTNVVDTSRTRTIHSSSNRTCIGIPGSPCAEVADTSVTYAANGSTVPGVDVATDWNWEFNSLDFHLHPTGQPDTRELDGIAGIDSDTDLEVTLTVDNFDPTFVMGNANAEGWETSKVDANTTAVTFTLQPADAYWHDEVANPDPNEWPLKNASATTHYDAVVDMSVIAIQNSFADKVQGGMVVTDAQAFAPPQYQAPSDGNAGKLQITVAAPHYQTDGQTVNTGFYTAIIPSGITTEWGVDASQLTATYDSESLASSVDELDSGAIKLETGIHYSSGTVTVSGDSGKPVAKTGADKSVDEDTSVSFDASSSTDDGAITGYAWDFDDDGTTDATGATPSHTFTDPGTYDVKLTVTDDSGKTSTNTVIVTVADVTDPSASAGSDRTVDEGASVDFDASASTDNAQVASYRWDFDGDGQTDATGATASHTFSSAGSYDVTLTVTDAAGNTDTVTVTVAVESAGDGGSSAGSSNDGGSDAPVTVSQDGDVTNVRVNDASEAGRIDLGDRGAVRGVGVDSLSVYTTASEFTLDVSAHESVPDGTPLPDRTDVGESTAGYLQIDHSVADAEISGVTIGFTVGWDALTSGTNASEVVLYRHHDGEWQPLATEFVRYTERGARFEAASPGLSVFAVGLETAAAFSVSPTAPAEDLTVGESVTVSARVSNDGTAAGTKTVALRADGAVRATEDVTLDAGETTTIELSTALDAAGDYDLSVDGVDAGTVSVTEASTAESTASATPTATATPASTPVVTATGTPESGPDAVETAAPTGTATDSAGGPGFGAGLAALAVLALSVALARRRD
ncbi:PKD domain-containing protein [Halosimplex amylolyticum]|uniref:PKD domain-containing protein n=1 Tax=Halosimplex amylolyticum TaxID=3396616 RepID=UPI003F575F16